MPANPSETELMLRGYGLTTAELFYRMPDYRHVLNSFVWQEYDIIFRAPRFDDAGNKIANARFERVTHNGIVIHEDVSLRGPTRGGAPGEVASGPLRLQGDHGPVAYRNIRIRRLEPAAGGE